MPLDRSRPLTNAGTVGVSNFDAPDPTFLETVGAAFRQENLIGSALTNANLWADQQALTKVDPNYNVYQDPDFADFIKDEPDAWDDVYNRTAADAKRAQIEKERKDRATLSASGWTGVGATLVAGIADPTILLPGGALARTGKVGFNAVRSAVSVGAAAAAGTAVQEAGLQATQELRTGTESALAIGGSAILGGLIGGAASKFLSTGEWSRVSKQIETDLADEGIEDAVGVTDTIVKRMQSAGAAAVDEIKLDDLGVGGPKAAQIVARATAAARLNPGIETMFSPSVKVREAYSRMVDNPVYTTMQMEGRSLGADVENLVKQYQRGALAQWLESSRGIYREARKAGYTGRKTEFYQAVAKAGRRGDVDPGGNEFITRAAQEARSTVFDPLLERAQRIGLLPEDVKVSTSASYVTRMWNRQKLIGEESRFKDIARKYFTGAVKQQVDALTVAKDNRVGRLKSVVADLELPSGQRATLLQSLPEDLKALREANPAFVQTDQELSSLRSHLFQAREANDRSKVQALSAQVDAISTKAGRDYADYVTKRNVLQSRISRIRNNVVGRASQIEAMQARIGDVEAANIERLRRLHRSLSIVDENIDRASPELLAERLSTARTKFAQVLERSAKAQDRLAKAREASADDVAKQGRHETDFDLAEARRIEEANDLADRIGDLEKVDPEDALTELRGLIERRLSEASEVVARENAKVVALAKRIEEANPKRVTDRIAALNKKITDAELDFNERVYVGMDGQNDFTDYVEDIVNSVFNNLTGRGKGDIPEWIVPATRGPLKERSFNIPDALVEDFLENDMEAILRKYSRTMAAEVELADKFGRADMQDQFKEIELEYNDLRAAAKTDDERNRLTAAEARDVKNLSAFRDMIRGTYRAADESSDWSKITRAALTWNYIRLLGGVTLASLTDASRFVAVHGVRATMREGLPALVKGVKAAQISRSDAKALGAVTERVLQSRLASLTDINDPYAYGSRFERFLSNSSNLFSKATGLGWWNDTLKTVSSVMTQNRMMRNALDWNGAGKTERAYMAYLGIDEDMAQRIAAQFKKHGIEEDGIYGANVSQWDDTAAVRAWGAALNKDVDRTIITKGVADTPLWMKTNWGRLIFQFKSFGLASHQRVLIAGLQERPHRLAEMMVMSSTIGMLIGYLKYVERGDMDEANKLLDNPGLWIAEGLDRSGVLSIPFEISNTAEKLGLPGVVTGAQALAGDEDRGGGASRYASRGKLGAVLGPSAGLFEDLALIAQQLGEGDLKKSGANAIIRQLPGATLPGVRTAIHVGVKPKLQEAVE